MGFYLVCLNLVFVFLLLGCVLFVFIWDSFEEYFMKMVNMGVVNLMKDFYWDIWLKFGYGMIEVCVMDMLLLVDCVVVIVCYI